MSDMISREDVLRELDGWFYDPQADEITDTGLHGTIRALPAVQPCADSFADLIADARLEAAKAMKKFPQPNYIISKVAEEAGEVVKAAIHCAEGRETAENVRGEIKQVIAMLYRLWVEGDQVHGLTPLDPALIDNPGEHTIATLYGALAQGQKRLGADFEAAWSANVDSLYDNSPGKEVMPDEASSARGSSDTAPAGLSAGGGADYDAVREAIQKMVGRRDEYGIGRLSADRAIAFLNVMEAQNCPAPRLLVEGGSPVFTWVIGGWKLYHDCDDEETQSFRWQGPPATEEGAGHRSDCAVHNAPAYPAGPCDCGFVATEGGA